MEKNQEGFPLEFEHISVLLHECVEGLNIRPGKIYMDLTAGGGGHSSAIARELTGGGRLIAVDKDPDAIRAAGEKLAPYPAAQVVQGDFGDFDRILDQLEITAVDGVLMDLGVSSHQLDVAERGFSYHQDAPLDMRMSQQGPGARELVNTADVLELERILREYGEEKFARRIAQRIVQHRGEQPIETTGELVEIIKEAIPAPARRQGGHPAKRSFQAIRIAVNGELESLSCCLEQAFERLAPGGRLAVITFHSLEDRMVKQRFAEYCRGCICPPDFPICTCGKTPRAKLVQRKPILPNEQELEQNNRSRSAKLRILEKL
ncbi:16S rRNA (cytosine(1402)-N(4))-methyltransferase RsmH [Oscillospiraceae bacterium MB08-C2-2]|nr:16S rRNA (cytosine(1402)-N(4))-methyltransferase RsmH [Oscillospiraceae bacterium MB08-C2-2]